MNSRRHIRSLVAALVALAGSWCAPATAVACGPAASSVGASSCCVKKAPGRCGCCKPANRATTRGPAVANVEPHALSASPIALGPEPGSCRCEVERPAAPAGRDGSSKDRQPRADRPAETVMSETPGRVASSAEALAVGRPVDGRGRRLFLRHARLLI